MKKTVGISALFLIAALFVSCAAAPPPKSALTEEITEFSSGISTQKTEEEAGILAVEKLNEKREEIRLFFDGFSGEEYRVGKGEKHTSLVSLLLDLKGNENRKTIYLQEGEYDLFAEYQSEVKKGRIQVPDDSVSSPDYMEPYNAFVPNNTRLIGEGRVRLSFTPSEKEISYGASRTFSPLNIYGNVMIENVEVIGKNCRYCLHNDDHGRYPGAVQYYLNCRFEYRLSEKDDDGKLLGFNNTVGFGISNGSTHVFENCEIFFCGEGNHSAYYGHNSSAPGKSAILLKNSWIHASDEKNTRVIRLQTLSHKTPGEVTTLIDSCTVNGGLLFHLYYGDSKQSFDVTFKNTAKMKILHENREGGPVRDPYTVKYLDGS